MISHPILSIHTISQSPTKQCGISDDIETTLRIYSCEIMQDAGILLKLPQVVIAHAQVLFHRFFMKRSMTQFDVRYCSIACLFLAAKLGEKAKSLQTVIEAFDFLWSQIRNENDYCSIQTFYQFHSLFSSSTQQISPTNNKNNNSYDPNSTNNYNNGELFELQQLMHTSMNILNMKNEVIRIERIICAELGFVLHNVEHAHTYILFFMHILEASDDLIQSAWNFCNDALRCKILCLHVKPHVIACGAIYMAANRLKIKLPSSPAWWLLFDTSLDDILLVEHYIHMLYGRPKAKYHHVLSLLEDNRVATCLYVNPEHLALIKGQIDEEQRRRSNAQEQSTRNAQHERTQRSTDSYRSQHRDSGSRGESRSSNTSHRDHRYHDRDNRDTRRDYARSSSSSSHSDRRYNEQRYDSRSRSSPDKYRSSGYGSHSRPNKRPYDSKR